MEKIIVENNLVVENLPMVIGHNYEQIRAQLKEYLDSHDIVVTEDTLRGSSDLATTLNKAKTSIAKRRKETVASASVEIKQFEADVKGLEAMCEESRQKILSQIAVFEKARLEAIQAALEELLSDCYKKQKVDAEFQTATITDLVKLGMFTATGKLTKAARDSVAARVGECVVKQSRTALRLSQLENESHRAGLHSPLTREHVAGILFDESDDKYASNLAQLITRELDRQTETLRRADELKQQELGDEAEKQDSAPALQDAEIPEEPAPAPKETGYIAQEASAPIPQSGRANGARAEQTRTRQVAVSVQLVVEVPVNVPLAAIEGVTRKKLEEAGFEKSLRTVTASETDL